MTELTVLPPHSLIIRSKVNAQSQDGGNPHQAVKNFDGTEGRTGRLLSIPLESPLQIFIYLLRADTDQIYTHVRF